MAKPPSKKLNFFDVDLPPGSYVVTVTTRATPLDLYVELPLERTASSRGVSTVISPVFSQKEKKRDREYPLCTPYQRCLRRFVCEVQRQESTTYEVCGRD